MPGLVTNELACAIGATNNGQTAQITFAVTNGVTVFVRVAGTSSLLASFQLTLTGPPCPTSIAIATA